MLARIPQATKASQPEACVAFFLGQTGERLLIYNLLTVVAPGSGKSMSRRLPGILPPLESTEALELGMIQSVAGGLRSGGLSRERPFPTPDPASLAALIGGGPASRGLSATSDAAGLG
jgi:predicted ATPase with chaperone activity